jgi:transcriptional regulator NrdR family protein
MKTIYECEKCGKRFDNFDHTAHKYAHLVIEENEYSQENPSYPMSIKVRMNDEAEVEYKFAKIVKQAEQATNDEENKEVA